MGEATPRTSIMAKFDTERARGYAVGFGEGMKEGVVLGMQHRKGSWGALAAVGWTAFAAAFLVAVLSRLHWL